MSAVQGTLFHLLPKHPRGDQLLPLKRLRSAAPDLYASHIAKYRGRMSDLDDPVTPLACTWGDVVFLSPVHPGSLFDALGRSGHRVSRAEPAIIHARDLDPAQCVIRLMRHGRDGHFPEPVDQHDYLPFTTAALRAVERVTVAAIARLEALAPGDPWLPWVDVPHVLHRGPIPLAKVHQAESSG